MAKYESGVKLVGYPQANVFDKLADLNNLSSIREKINDPVAQDKLKGQIPEDKFEQVKKQLESMTFDADSASVNVAPIGNVSIRIVEREPDKCIKFESVNSPIPFKMWIQILPTTELTSKMRLTVDASLNMFIKGMVEKPLKEGIEKLADVLAAIPYND
ncbi:MAG: SRPBCC family protein [Bacteroidaceae bacterium]|nr:SRPBCC family protein [Bacteroidaceae bacterium]